MERLKQMKDQLVSCVQGQMSNLAQADTHEMGEAIDMIKDLEEAMYYCSITKAMEDREKEEKEYKGHDRHYYIEKYLPYPMMDERDMDRDRGRMYYSQGRNSQGQFTGSRGGHADGPYMDGHRVYYGGDGNSDSSGNTGSSGGNSGNMGFHDRDYPMEMRDYREGSSPIRRKYYMESKELHKDKKTQMEELEKYMQELSKDITEMIGDASPEETTLLKQKLVTLIEKIK